MNKKVRGLVIAEKSINESDKLLTILTEKGKLKAVARGVKKPKSKYAAACRLYSWANFVYHPGKSLATITEANLIEAFYNICLDYDKLIYSSYILDLVNKITMEDYEEDSLLLKLLVYYLFYLNHKDVSLLLLTLGIQLKILQNEGIIPEINMDSIKDYAYFSIYDGTISKDFQKGQKLQYKLSLEQVYTIYRLFKNPFNSIIKESYSLTDDELKKLIKIFNIFIEETLSINLKSFQVIEKSNELLMEVL